MLESSLLNFQEPGFGAFYNLSIAFIRGISIDFDALAFHLLQPGSLVRDCMCRILDLLGFTAAVIDGPKQSDGPWFIDRGDERAFGTSSRNCRITAMVPSESFTFIRHRRQLLASIQERIGNRQVSQGIDSCQEFRVFQNRQARFKCIKKSKKFD